MSWPRRYRRAHEYGRKKKLSSETNKSVATFIANALAVHKVVIVDSVACLFGSAHLLPGGSGSPRAALVANTFKLYVAPRPCGEWRASVANSRLQCPPPSHTHTTHTRRCIDMKSHMPVDEGMSGARGMDVDTGVALAGTSDPMFPWQSNARTGFDGRTLATLAPVFAATSAKAVTAATVMTRASAGNRSKPTLVAAITVLPEGGYPAGAQEVVRQAVRAAVAWRAAALPLAGEGFATMGVDEQFADVLQQYRRSIPREQWTPEHFCEWANEAVYLSKYFYMLKLLRPLDGGWIRVVLNYREGSPVWNTRWARACRATVAQIRLFNDGGSTAAAGAGAGTGSGPSAGAGAGAGVAEPEVVIDTTALQRGKEMNPRFLVEDLATADIEASEAVQDSGSAHRMDSVQNLVKATLDQLTDADFTGPTGRFVLSSKVDGSMLRVILHPRAAPRAQRIEAALRAGTNLFAKMVLDLTTALP